MARTAITPQALPGAYPALPITAEARDLAWAAMSGSGGANGNQAVMTGREILVFRNDDAAPQTVTITSIADDKNRTGDITTYSIGIGEYAIFGPFAVAGWRQADGNIYFEASAATVFCAVLRIP